MQKDRITKQTISPLARQPASKSSTALASEEASSSSGGSERESKHTMDFSAQEDSEAIANETLDSEFELTWRPKRGSIQLPSFSEGTFLEVEVKNYEKYVLKS